MLLKGNDTMLKHHVRKAIILSRIKFEVTEQSESKVAYVTLRKTAKHQKRIAIVKPTFATTTVE